MLSFAIEQEALRLFESGYCCTSSRYHMVARIDRPDWREVTAKHHAPWDPEGQGMQWVTGPHIADYYRRVLSKDKLTLDADVFVELKNRHRLNGGGAGWPGGGQFNDFIPLRSIGARAIQL